MAPRPFLPAEPPGARCCLFLRAGAGLSPEKGLQPGFWGAASPGAQPGYLQLFLGGTGIHEAFPNWRGSRAGHAKLFKCRD